MVDYLNAEMKTVHSVPKTTAATQSSDSVPKTTVAAQSSGCLLPILITLLFVFGLLAL